MSLPWEPLPPSPSDLSDHDVRLEGDRLAGRRVALVVTGGIAAMLAPQLARSLRKHGAEVTAFASEEALRYVAIDALAWCTNRPVVTQLSHDAEHLGGKSPFDAFLVAPATYNTINKLRYGIADTPITAVLAAALGRIARGESAILLAPTMHGVLHTPILTESVKVLQGLGVRVIPPRDEYGKHNLPRDQELVAEVCRAVSRSPVKGKSILVTAGPTPVAIDGVRRITTLFTGRLGTYIADELHLRGADVTLLFGRGSAEPPTYLPCIRVDSFDTYRQKVTEILASKPHHFGVFSAAVADYRPETVQPGKIPSGRTDLTLRLTPTPKVIDEVRLKHQDLHMVTFKYEENISHERLIRTARERLARGFDAVVANRGDEQGPHGEQVAYLVTKAGESGPFIGKRGIARVIAEYLEGGRG